MIGEYRQGSGDFRDLDSAHQIARMSTTVEYRSVCTTLKRLKSATDLHPGIPREASADRKRERLSDTHVPSQLWVLQNPASAAPGCLRFRFNVSGCAHRKHVISEFEIGNYHGSNTSAACTENRYGNNTGHDKVNSLRFTWIGSSGGLSSEHCLCLQD